MACVTTEEICGEDIDITHALEAAPAEVSAYAEFYRKCIWISYAAVGQFL